MSQTPHLLLNIEAFVREQTFATFLKRFSLIHQIPLLVINHEGVPLFQTCPIPIPPRFVFPDREDRYSQLYTKAGLSFRIQPLFIYNHLAGYLACPAEEGDEEREGLLDLALVFVHYYFTSHFEIESLSQETVETYKEINFLFNFIETLCSVSTLEEVCQKAVDKVTELVEVQRVSILLLDKKHEQFFIAASRGLDHVDLHTRIPSWKGMAGRVLKKGEGILLEDTTSLPRELTPYRERYQSRSFVSVPLQLHRGGEKKILGVFNLADKASGEAFSSSDLKLIQAIADQVAVILNQIQFIEIQKEMQITREIQQNFLPHSPPEIKGIDLAGNCTPAKNVGGDYYDYFAYEEDRLGIVIADVSGHNTASALIMASARSTLRSVLNQRTCPLDILRETNRLLLGDLEKAGLLISMCFVDLQVETGAITLSNAGHNYPLLWKASTREVVELNIPGIILGCTENPDFRLSRQVLERGDLLLLYTDGAVESRNPADEFFGENRLISFLQDHHPLPAKEFIEALSAEINRFTCGGGNEDDITLVALKRL